MQLSHHDIQNNNLAFNSIQDGLFGGCSRIGGEKSPCNIYPAMIKLGTVIPYLRKIKKIYEHVTQPLSYADIRMLSPIISKFCFFKKYRCRFHFDT